MRSYKRTDRIASLIKQAMSELFLFEVRDPRVRTAVVTHVFVTADMGLARVYVRPIAGADQQGRKELMAGLNKSKAFLRGALCKRVQLMRAPQLEFFFDEVPDEVARIDELLANLDKPAQD